MKTKYLILVLLFFVAHQLKAQLGGESTYEFLNLPNSARMAALGGSQVAIYDATDLNVAYNNPSLLHEEMDGHLLMNYVSYLGDVNFGYAAYAKDFGDKGMFALGIHYINYGKFTYADEFGEKPGGTFNAAEYAFDISWSKQFGRLRTGATLKPILSAFENYQSFGLAADLGVSLVSDDELTTLGLVVNNIGAQITTYYEGADRESIPFDMQLGFSRRLPHAPVRLAATLHHLHDWNLGEYLQNEDETAFVKTDEGFGKQFLRHLILGVELLPSKNFTLRAGYNYQRRKELVYDGKASTVGFSWGLGFKVSRFHFNYGSARYHLSATSNHFSVSINLNEGLR